MLEKVDNKEGRKGNTGDSIAYMDAHYRTILFSGFHILPEHRSGGWVYWLPRYLHQHTSLQIFFLSNDQTLYRLDTKGNVLLAERNAVPSIDLFFGRTLSSFDPDDQLVKSAAIKLIYPMGKKLSKSLLSQNVYVIDDADFVKPIPEYERQFFYNGSGRRLRENIVLFPASLHPRKGQLKFSKAISPQILQGKKLIFCGPARSPNYADQCFEILKKKKIDFSYLQKVNKNDLGEIYRKSRLTVIYSSVDWNPRTYYESLICGTPCLLSKNVKIATGIDFFSLRTSSFALNRSLARAYQYPEDLPLVLSEKTAAITEETACYNRLFSPVLPNNDNINPPTVHPC